MPVGGVLRIKYAIRSTGVFPRAIFDGRRHISGSVSNIPRLFVSLSARESV
jgi:hypothetical protein